MTTERRAVIDVGTNSVKLLVAEVAGQRGAIGIAQSAYLDLARQTRDPRIARRAAEISMFARDQAGALEATRLWAATEPSWPMVRRRSGAVLSSSSTSYHVSGRPWVSCSSRSKRGTSAACTLSSAPHVSARSSGMTPRYQVLCVRTHFDITMCVRT